MASLLALLGADPAHAASCARPEPIVFGADTFFADVAADVERGEFDCRTITGRAGQQLSVELASRENNVVFSLYRPGWTALPAAGLAYTFRGSPPGAPGDAIDATRWSGALPDDGTYLVVVGTTRGDGAYRLHVEVRSFRAQQSRG